MATRVPAVVAPTGHASSYSVPVPRSASVALLPVSVAVSSRRKQIIGAGTCATASSEPGCKGGGDSRAQTCSVQWPWAHFAVLVGRFKPEQIVRRLLSEAARRFSWLLHLQGAAHD